MTENSKIEALEGVDVAVYGNDLTRCQRWMLYPVYVAAALVYLDAVVFLLSLESTRQFIGNGSEFCWMFGSFQRYVFVSVALFIVDVPLLCGLYLLARRNYLIAYLIVWALWLLTEPVLSHFDLGYC
jgi:hypothetical protein